MKTIYWDDSGAAVDVVRCITDGLAFTVVVTGPLAAAFVSTLGAERVGFTPQTGRVLIAVVVVLAVAGLVLFALAKGYKISGKARTPDGTQYEITFEPKT